MAFKLFLGAKIGLPSCTIVDALEKAVELEDAPLPEAAQKIMAVLPPSAHQDFRHLFAQYAATIANLQFQTKQQAATILKISTKVFPLEEFRAQTLDNETESRSSRIRTYAHLAACVTVTVSSSFFGLFGTVISLPIAEAVHDRISLYIPFGPTEMEVLKHRRKNPSLSDMDALSELLAEIIEAEGFDFPLPSSTEISNYIKSYPNASPEEALRRLVQLKLHKARLSQDS